MKTISRKKNPFFFQNFHVDKRVIKPLQTLLESFQGPTRLIMKRQDKHIDFSASTQRAEKNKDPSKNRMVKFLRNFNFYYSYPIMYKPSLLCLKNLPRISVCNLVSPTFEASIS